MRAFLSRFSRGLSPFVVIVAVSLAATAARGQSDACLTATPIGEGTFSGSTDAATNDGDATCGDSDATPDVWYRFTPAADCALAVDTCGSDYDTVVSIHSGCPATAGNTLACNDDSCVYSSSVYLAAAAGTPYLIRVSGWNGMTGDYVLHVACSPPQDNDACVDAIDVTAGNYSGSTLLASIDGGASCDGPQAAADVWYRYTAASDCRLTVDTCGSAFDTVLSAHSACPGTAGNELQCNDESCLDGSRVRIDVVNGQSVLIRVSGYDGAAGPYVLHVTCGPPGPGGADAVMSELTELTQYGREGDVIGCITDTPICNLGDEPLDWYGLPDERHPNVVFNMYRLKAGRLEQIGQSWVKHGLGAVQLDTCGIGCIPYPNGTRLGVGCSDSYNASFNAVQNNLGPRSEINPWTGVFTYDGSHFDQFGSHNHDDVQHRLQIHDADLSPALNPGAQYFVEVYAVAHDDVDHMNSVAREPVGISGAPGGEWDFNVSATATTIGPAIEAWSGATRTQIPATTTDDGRCILAIRASDNGNGTWHYEYALYNHDMDRGVRSFSIPVADAVAVTNIGFHAVESHDEPFSNAAWTMTRANNAITWTTTAFGAQPPGNPLRWGTMYNFRFDAATPPHGRTATLGLWKPGVPASLSGATTGPAGTGIAGDANCDGLIDFFDIDPFILALFDASGYAAAYPWCDHENADTNEDQGVNFFDIDVFLDLLF